MRNSIDSRIHYCATLGLNVPVDRDETRPRPFVMPLGKLQRPRENNPVLAGKIYLPDQAMSFAFNKDGQKTFVQ